MQEFFENFPTMKTPRRGDPICCANRWCWFSFIPGWGRGIMWNSHENDPRNPQKTRRKNKKNL